MSETAHYLLSRLVTTALIIFGSMLLLFSLSTIVPGDPATSLLGPQATPEYARQFIQQMGLDQPVPIRLWRFFSSLLSGNLGVDVVSGKSVASIVAAVIPYTIVLTFAAIGL